MPKKKPQPGPAQTTRAGTTTDRIHRPLQTDAPPVESDNPNGHEGHSVAPVNLTEVTQANYLEHTEEIQYTPEEFPEGPYGSSRPTQ